MSLRTGIVNLDVPKWARLLLTGLALALFGCSGSTPSVAHIHVDQISALVDTPLSVTVSSLGPNAQVTIGATAAACDGTRYRSRATFVADSSGDLNLASSAPVSGSYTGAHAMGPFWSMEPTGGGQTLEYEFCMPHGGFDVTLTATAAGREVATLAVRRLWSLPGITDRPLRPATDGFYGEYLSPAPGTPTHPGILLLGGSEGGLSVLDDAAALASHGYPSLALAYFDEPGIPATEQNIPLEYFARALRWLATQPGVDPNHLVVDGASRGGEGALLLGVYYPTLVHAVIAQTTSSTVECGFDASQQRCAGAAWTFHGAPLPYSRTFDDPLAGGDTSAVIAVEKIDGPILHDCAGDDRLIPSCVFGQAIEDQLDGANFRFVHQLLTYQDAGHWVNAGVPYRPVFDAYLGGTVEANELGMADFWSHQLAFLASIGG